jgi:NTF2-related export protein 1/2
LCGGREGPTLALRERSKLRNEILAHCEPHLRSFDHQLPCRNNRVARRLLTMAALTETDYTRASTEAAESFADSYYTALNGSRNQLASFYVPPVTQPSGRGLPHISYNGDVLNDATVFATRFEKEMPWTHWEPQSLDVHVLNRALTPVEGKSKKELERNMSLTVQVSGYVRLYERKDGPMKGFSDSFVLVPNKEEVGAKGTGKSGQGRQWVIQTQNMRFVT